MHKLYRINVRFQQLGPWVDWVYGAVAEVLGSDEFIEDFYIQIGKTEPGTPCKVTVEFGIRSLQNVEWVEKVIEKCLIADQERIINSWSY